MPDTAYIYQEFSRDRSMITHRDKWMRVVRFLDDRDDGGRFM